MQVTLRRDSGESMAAEDFEEIARPIQGSQLTEASSVS